ANSSCSRMICAPCWAASRTRRSALRMFSELSVVQAICVAAMVTWRVIRLDLRAKVEQESVVKCRLPDCCQVRFRIGYDDSWTNRGSYNENIGRSAQSIRAVPQGQA